MTSQVEDTFQSISYIYRERTKREDPFFSLWEFEVAPGPTPRDNMTAVTPAAYLRPTTTFQVLKNDNHPISVMIASRYTKVNSKLRWLYRIPSNGTIGWRNFYHELLIDMPVVDWPEGRISCTVFPKMVFPSQHSTGGYFTHNVYFQWQS